MKVYVVIPDFGYDGFSGPIAAFKWEQDAEQFIEDIYSWKQRKPNECEFHDLSYLLKVKEEWENEMPDVPYYCNAYKIFDVEVKE